MHVKSIIFIILITMITAFLIIFCTLIERFHSFFTESAGFGTVAVHVKDVEIALGGATRRICQPMAVGALVHALLAEAASLGAATNDHLVIATGRSGGAEREGGGEEEGRKEWRRREGEGMRRNVGRGEGRRRDAERVGGEEEDAERVSAQEEGSSGRVAG